MRDASIDPLAGLFTDVSLMATTYPPVEYAVPGVIPEGLSLLVSAPKIGKSWLVLGIGVACASGGRALGRIRVEPRPVLYLALEDGPRRLQSRKIMMGVPDGVPGLMYGTRVDHDTNVVEMVRAYLTSTPGKPLIVVDTLGKVMPTAFANETTYERDYRVSGWLKEITTEFPGASVVVVHHSRKADASDFVDAVNGTNGLAGGADSIIVVRRKRHESTGTLHVTGRDIPEGRYAVTFDPTTGLWALDGASLYEASRNADQADQTTGVGDAMGAIIRTVEELGTATACQVAGKLSMDNDTVGRYLRRAVNAGRIAKASYGKYRSVAVSDVSECPTSLGLERLYAEDDT